MLGYEYDAPIHLGTFLPSPLDEPATVWTDDQELRDHKDRPWLRAYAAAYLGADPPGRGLALFESGAPPGAAEPGPYSAATVPASALACHTCIFGSTGSGKSRLALQLIGDQMRQGCSVVALDPKAQTIGHLLAQARAAGLTPDQVVVLSAADLSRGVPGWNPLLTGVPAAQAADDLVSTLAHSTDSWGPRLGDILTNALILLAAHRLSLYELPRLPEYRDGLLRLPLPPRGPGIDAAALREAHGFFAHEFSAWSRTEQASAVGPVLNKTRRLLGSDFFQALLCARRNTLDLAGLWQRQGVLLVHLDPTTLGDDGAKLLGGLLAHHLHRTAMRAPGPVPVVLALDELGMQERVIGSALLKIVAMARSQNLRLLAASQHLSQLSGELRETLINNAGVQVYFRLGPSDARPAASSFAVGTSAPLQRATMRVAVRDRETGLAERTSWRHSVLDSYGVPLKLSSEAWQAFLQEQVSVLPAGGFALRRLQELAGASDFVRLYVHAADTGDPVALSEYVAGLAETDFWFEGPVPLELVVGFPRPQFSRADLRQEGDLAGSWMRILLQLPRQHAVLLLANGSPRLFRVADVPDPGSPVALLDWWRASTQARSQRPDEIEATAAWRIASVEWLSQGRLGQEQSGRHAIEQRGSQDVQQRGPLALPPPGREAPRRPPAPRQAPRGPQQNLPPRTHPQPGPKPEARRPRVAEDGSID